MSRREMITLLDDFDLLGRVETPAEKTIEYFDPLDGTKRILDLTHDNANDVLGEWKKLRMASRPAGPKVRGRRRNTTPVTVASWPEIEDAPAPSEADSPGMIRAWLRDNGYTVKDRGNIAKHLRTAYDLRRPAPVEVVLDGLEDLPQGQRVPVVEAEVHPEVGECDAGVVPGQLNIEIFEPTEWEAARPGRESAGLLVSKLTDEQRLGQLKESHWLILRALSRGVPQSEINGLAVKATRTKLRNLGMLDGADGALTLTPRAVHALARHEYV